MLMGIPEAPHTADTSHTLMVSIRNPREKVRFACSMLGKSSKPFLPNGGLMVMNPMVEM